MINIKQLPIGIYSQQTVINIEFIKIYLLYTHICKKKT